MGTRRETTTSTEMAVADQDATRGFSSVGNIALRVAGWVPTRVDLRFAGTPQRQLGLSLGTILVYMGTHLTAKSVVQGWSDAAAHVRLLPQVLPDDRRPALASGPWLLSAMVRFAGIPGTTATVMTPKPGRDLPTMLRIQVGPVTWEIADAAAYTSMLNAWRIAADLLAAPGGEPPTR